MGLRELRPWTLLDRPVVLRHPRLADGTVEALAEIRMESRHRRVVGVVAERVLELVGHQPHRDEAADAVLAAVVRRVPGASRVALLAAPPLARARRRSRARARIFSDSSASSRPPGAPRARPRQATFDDLDSLESGHAREYVPAELLNPPLPGAVGGPGVDTKRRWVHCRVTRRDKTRFEMRTEVGGAFGDPEQSTSKADDAFGFPEPATNGSDAFECGK